MASKRGTLSGKVPSKELSQALNQAAALMRRKKQQVMTAEMLLLAFITTPGLAVHQLLRDFSRERGFDWDNFERDVDRTASDRWRVPDEKFDFVAENRNRVSLSAEMIIVLDEGLAIAEERGESQCGTLHALAVMADIRIGTYWLLKRRGITRQAIMDEFAVPAMTVDHVARPQPKHRTLVYHRDKLLDKLINLLSMASDRHVILIGPVGVGKRSLVLSLAQLIEQGKGPTGIKSVVELDEWALLDDALGTVQNAIRQARGGILFVPNIDRFFGGIRAEFREDASNALQKAFFTDDVVVIGTVTEEGFTSKLQKAGAVVAHSQVLRVPPATVKETTNILKTLQPKFETDYELTIVDESLSEAARLAGRYYTAEPLPRAAVHLVHRACAMVKMSISEVAGSSVKKDDRLDPDDVMVAASLLTGIPVTNMGADERDRYVHMVDHLHKRIIGQDEAVVALSRAVKMARVGLKDPHRPIGSFLFLGPTGVGKTELAKALAEFMFGTESALTTLDMSEFMDDSSVNRLIGSPPGYVGHEAGGQLTDAVRKRPYSVVLFDEVEKASIKVFDVLLQIMEEGRLTSGKSETVHFSECVILMTSNIGSRYLSDPELSEAVARDEADEALKEHFRPEFLNRLTDIIFFHLLSDENLRDILDLLLRKEEDLMATRGLQLAVTKTVKTWLLDQNDHPEWGARPLRRIIQKYIREPMADFLLEEDPQPGTTVRVRVKNKELFFETK